VVHTMAECFLSPQILLLAVLAFIIAALQITCIWFFAVHSHSDPQTVCDSYRAKSKRTDSKSWSSERQTQLLHYIQTRSHDRSSDGYQRSFWWITEKQNPSEEQTHPCNKTGICTLLKISSTG
jgi:hypothetical protein